MAGRDRTVGGHESTASSPSDSSSVTSAQVPRSRRAAARSPRTIARNAPGQRRPRRRRRRRSVRQRQTVPAAGGAIQAAYPTPDRFNSLGTEITENCEPAMSATTAIRPTGVSVAGTRTWPPLRVTVPPPRPRWRPRSTCSRSSACRPGPPKASSRCRRAADPGR